MIIFFTDGQDGSGLNKQDKLRLAKTFADSDVAVEVHTIGFTSDHDAGKYHNNQDVINQLLKLQT